MHTCRFCRKEVDERARKCPYCQSSLWFGGRLSIFQKLASVLLAVAGLGFGYVERQQAQEARSEQQLEQDAMKELLQSIPEEQLAASFQAGDDSEEQLKAQLKRNPRDVNARIRLRMKQQRPGRPQFRRPPGKTKEVAGFPPGRRRSRQ